MHGEQLTLDLFERLPRRPYCADDLAAGVRIRGLEQALKCRYIQPNPPDLKFWLVYDIDRAAGAMAWDDVNLPAPNWSATNPKNGHAHLAYGIRVPVYTADPEHDKPLRLAAAIDQAYREKLKADLGYVGLITKNPTHPDWLVSWHTHHLYELGELAEWVELPRKVRKNARLDYGLGRNVTLFEKLRYWAYAAVLEYRLNGAKYEQWHQAVLAQASKYNDFPAPLPENEVGHTAKSVSKWVWNRYTGRMSDEAFTQRQAARGKRRAEQRRAGTTAEITEAYATLARNGKKPTKRAVAELVGISHQKLSEDYKGLWITLEAQHAACSP